MNTTDEITAKALRIYETVLSNYDFEVRTLSFGRVADHILEGLSLIGDGTKITDHLNGDRSAEAIDLVNEVHEKSGLVKADLAMAMPDMVVVMIALAHDMGFNLLDATATALERYETSDTFREQAKQSNEAAAFHYVTRDA